MKEPRKGGAMGITNFLSINKSPDERDGMAGTICVWGAQMWVERATPPSAAVRIAMNTVQMNGSEIYRSFLGTNDDVSNIFTGNIHNGIFAQKWHFDQQSTSSSNCDIASDRCTAYSIFSF